MAKYRKKPVVIEAWQYPNDIRGVCNCDDDTYPHVHTAHAGQTVTLESGDWIIPEPDGQYFYPCKPDIFEQTYESIDILS